MDTDPDGHHGFEVGTPWTGDCPRCSERYTGNFPMWKVPLGPDRWLFRCPVCTVMVAMVVADSGLDIPQIPGEIWEEDWEIVAED